MVLWGDEFDSYLADEPLSQQLRLPPSPTLQQLEQELSSDSEPGLSQQQLEQGLSLDCEPVLSQPPQQQGLSAALQQDTGLQQQQAELNVGVDLSAAAAQVRAGSGKHGQGQRCSRDSEVMLVDEGVEVTAVRQGRGDEAARNAMSSQERGQTGSGAEGDGAGAVEVDGGTGAALVKAGHSTSATTAAATGPAAEAGQAAAATVVTGAGAAAAAVRALSGGDAVANAQAAAAGAARTDAMGKRGSGRGPPPCCHPSRWVPPSKQLLPRSSIFYGTSCGRRAGLPSKGQ